MLTVPEAARRVGRDPETVRRWIRAGKLRARKVGTQHVIEEEDLEAFASDEGEELPYPESWKFFESGQPQPNWTLIIRRQRGEH
jgi:excisionase family DNA binding protein